MEARRTDRPVGRITAAVGRARPAAVAAMAAAVATGWLWTPDASVAAAAAGGSRAAAAPGGVPPAAWWSLSPLASPAPPADPELGPGAGQVLTPVDRFVLAKLQEHGLSLARSADRRTLLRRVHYDLTGLPPTPEEVQEFVGDGDPRAYEKRVDALLDSVHYGERWARHWLDVVGYADTHGYDKDKPRPNAWPYRDYVIRSLNADKPWARFVREQLAGDVLWPGAAAAAEATGFIAAGPWDLIGHEEVPEEKYDGMVARHLDRDGMASTTLNAFCSLTVQCAQCHDHKNDPVTTTDYYRLQAVFAALDRADRPIDDDPATGAERARLHAVIADLERESSTTPEPTAEVAAGIEAATDALAALPEPRFVYAGTVHRGGGNFVGRAHLGGAPRPVHVLARGDVRQPGDEVGPGAPPLVPGVPAAFDLPGDHGEGDRRVALAGWVVHPENPLTWRSIANRVWQHHFGTGIVDTPNDFGRLGGTPSHPQLLDWLAARLRDHGGSLKDLHRQICLSSTYRQASGFRPDAAEIDAGNRLLWSMPRRKLDAEAVRDSILAAGGKLDRTPFGPPFQDFTVEKPEHSPHYHYHLHDPDDPVTQRRSIYRFTVRSQPQPFMDALDCADASQRVAVRGETLTAPQALALLNSRFVVRMSEHFAERVRHEVPGSPAEQAAAAFAIAVGRPPDAVELDQLASLARDHGLEAACRAVFNLNAFLFVD